MCTRRTFDLACVVPDSGGVAAGGGAIQREFTQLSSACVGDMDMATVKKGNAIFSWWSTWTCRDSGAHQLLALSWRDGINRRRRGERVRGVAARRGELVREMSPWTHPF